jgi:predicted nucleotidyltransferase
MVTIVTNMITLFKTGYIKIMQLFYRDKNIRLHLREMARQTRLHEPSITRFLKNLEKENILKSEKEANLKKYFINKSKETYFMFEFFDIEKYNKLPRIRKEAIYCYLNKLEEKPIFVIIFGSTAKETYSEDSDVDILLILNKKIKVDEAEKEVDALTAVKISTFQMTYEDFLEELKLKNDKVVQSALITGYPLINHILFYEVICNERI